MVRAMTPDDLEPVVAIHLASFPGFFLTFLGRRFLALLYQNIQRDAGGVVLVAEEDGQIAGFVAGVTRQDGFYKRLIQRQLFGFSWAALGAALRQPAIVPRLVRALRRPAEAQTSAAEACLMSIAVLPAAAGRGVGRQLVQAFSQAMRERGISKYCLTTDRDNNAPVNQFYHRAGFRLSGSFVTPEGRAMNEYLMLLEKNLP